MFRKSHKETVVPFTPVGISELVIRVVDEKQKVRYSYRGGDAEPTGGGLFCFLESAPRTVEHPLLNDAISSRTSVSMALSLADGLKKYIYILPFELKRNRWRFVCLQVTAAPPDPDTAEDPTVCKLAEERACIVLVDSQQVIRSVSPRIPQSFGYGPDNLTGRPLKDLFSAPDYQRIKEGPEDTNEVMMSCPLFCLDGAKRDVEIKKYSLPDHYALYGICDVSPHARGEELVEVTARERQRIGQDLHDSIGQTLTGISLLSRSLSNALIRDGHAGSGDASQISGLADEASNQIRQISRGLMPSEVVQFGLSASLRELARMTTRSCGIACEARLDDTIRFGDVAVETHLYRIAQEAVNNSVRHGAASLIEIVISESDGVQRLEVIDNGRWVEPEADVIGIGMKTMEYRASAIGGRLNISTSRRGGTRVSCALATDESLVTGIYTE